MFKGTRKTVAAVIGAVVVTIPLVWDHHIDATEAVTLVTAWGTAFGVYGVRNK